MRMTIAISSALVAILAIGSPALADYDGVVSVGQSYGPYQTGLGGEFTLNRVSGWVGLTGLASDDQGSSTFQSFCVQTGEYIYKNQSYNVNLSTATVQGNVPLTDKVAYLYHNFRYGTLTDYDYATNESNREGDAGRLQQAIWKYMGVSGYGSVSNEFTALADEKVGTSEWATGYLGDVRILNMYNGHLQDQLTIIPAPGAVLLGVIGLGLIGWARRRFV